MTVVAALYLARDLLIPIALAALLAFLLSPLVAWLQRRRLGRTPAVLVATALAFSVIGSLGWVVIQQGLELTSHLPEYRDNIQARIESLQPDRDSPLSRAAETIEDIGAQIDGAQDKKDAVEERSGSEGRDAPTPVQVEVVERRSTLDFLTSTAGPLLSPLGTASIVIVLVIFMLLGREDLRDRLIHLMGRTDLHLTTQALEDAGGRVSRYLLMQLAVNLVYAVPIAIGLLAIGVPNAILFALLGGALRFVPYLGPLVAAALPIALSLAVFDDWTHPILTISLYVVVETVINNVVEPWLYGSSTGMSSIAVIAAAIFWTWLWGPLGLLMATPLTATLVGFGKHVPQLEFLNILLGDEPVGAPSERLYQRLLAMDSDEASAIAESSLDDFDSLTAAYDEVVLPALKMAEEDRQRDRLDDEHIGFIRETIADIAELLLEKSEQKKPDEAPELARPWASVLCITARGAADEIAARILTDVLRARGQEADAIGAASLLSERIEAVAERGRDAVCISALPPFGTVHARHLCKRIRARFPEIPIVVGLWLAPSGSERAWERMGIPGCTVVSTITQASERLRHVATAFARGQTAAGQRT